MGEHKFRQCAIVMIDALGFKGIWKHHDLDSVLEKLQLIETKMKALEKSEDFVKATTIGHYQQVSFISDTIVIACADETDEPDPSRAILVASWLASYVTHLGAAESEDGHDYKVQLAYRGAISFGDVWLNDRYVIGQAVDEAADNMDRAEGAFVWLTESALEQYEPDEPELLNRVACKWNVPLKPKNQAAQTWVVHPFQYGADNLDQKRKNRDLLLRTFDRSLPEVAKKRDNTERFLNHALGEYARQMGIED